MHFLTSDTNNWSGPVNIWSGPAASGSNRPDCLAAKKINVEPWFMMLRLQVLLFLHNAGKVIQVPFSDNFWFISARMLSFAQDNEKSLFSYFEVKK